jgi:hypothetical protein
MRRSVATSVALVLLACGSAAAAPSRDRLVINGSTYQLVVSKGEVAIFSRRTRLLHGPLIDSGRVTYRWNAKSSTLTLAAPSGTVTLRARPTFFDLRLTLTNPGETQTAVPFPAGLVGDVTGVSAGYAPNALPGVRLKPAFFSRVGSNVDIYPSRWAFADYLALDVGRAHVAVYSVARGPIRPVMLGFAHYPAGRCAGGSFCVVHEFQTWIPHGRSWVSPVVRVRVGGTVQQSILAYRRDNGIDAYPSVQKKLGGRLQTLARAPLIKTDLQALAPFRDLDVAELPSPVLVHPVAYQPGGHDVNVPDVLPPDPRFGTTADFRQLIERAHAHGDLVMPYDNVSWWDPASPTMRSSDARDVAVLDEHGEPVSVEYNGRSGVIVSAASPVVRARIARQMDAWRTDVPADCLFLDQLGARPWLRDFNPAAPSPESYDDSWLALLAPYANRCVMVEDGWDRLARDSTGFHGGLLMMARELDAPNTLFGAGNWEPYPLAVWLLHDKVLMYQHDLYEPTMAIDGEVLTWNLAFGMISSYRWDGGTRSWLDLVADLQRTLGPHYAGVPLARYRSLAPAVTESTFGDLTVIANRDASNSFAVDGYDIAPNGFLARTPGAVAGALSDAAGVHYVLVERRAGLVTVRQPIGADTSVSIEPPPGSRFQATAIDVEGAPIGSVAGELRNGRFTFPYTGVLNGRQVAAYRITAQ